MPTTRVVLVVDDEPLFRQMVVDALNEWLPDTEALGAANGREALHLSEAKSPHVIVTELHMPEMDGITLCRELLNRGSRAAVIVTTAHATPELERWMTARLAFEVFQKPVDLVALLAAVDRLMKPAETGHLEGVTLPGLCQLLQLERKTCEVRVKARQQAGRLLFRSGVLVDAVHDGAEGNVAAMNILAWRAPSVEISGRTPQTEQHRVTEDVTFLILEAFRLLDEEGKVPSSGGSRRTQSGDLDLGKLRLALASSVEATPRKADVGPPETSRPQARVHAAAFEPKSLADRPLRALERLVRSPGVLAAALVDADSDVVLAENGAVLPSLSAAAIANARVLRANQNMLATLGLPEVIDDIVLTLPDQYHLIRPHPERAGVFFYVAADRHAATLALVRIILREIAQAPVEPPPSAE